MIEIKAKGDVTLHTAGKYCEEDILVTVDVPSKEPKLQNKTITENGTYSADDEYDGLGVITVKFPIGDEVEY